MFIGRQLYRFNQRFQLLVSTWVSNSVQNIQRYSVVKILFPFFIDSPVNAVTKRLIYAYRNLVRMVFASIVYIIMNAFVNLDGWVKIAILTLMIV